MEISDSLLMALRKACGHDGVLSDPAQTLAYESDGLGFLRRQPDCVVLPPNAASLRQCVAALREAEIPWVVRGAGTGLSGACVAAQGGVLVHLSRLKNILSIEPENLSCCVEPGVVLNHLNKVLEPLGVFYPPDPSSGFACTLGGNVATNAGGIRCFKYGVTSHYVKAVEMLLPDGELRIYSEDDDLDLRALMVGSEGLLGVITRIWLRLKPLPGSPCTFLATFADLESASRAVVDLVHHPCIPVAIELLDKNTVALVEASPMKVGFPQGSWVLLVEINGPLELVQAQAPGIEALLKKAGCQDLRSTFDSEERLKLWKARKAAGGLVGQISPDVMIQDTVIPRNKIAEVLAKIYATAEELDLPVINVFHAGDGNLHPNFMFDSSDPASLVKVKEAGSRLMKAVLEAGGTLSGEHGIGEDKMGYLPMIFGPRELAAQRAVVAAFNPGDQLNPGKVLPGRIWRRRH